MKTINGVINVVFVISAIISLIFISITIVDLLINYKRDLSYQGCIVFKEKFDFCKEYIAFTIAVGVFIMHIQQRNYTQKKIENEEIKRLHEIVESKISKSEYSKYILNSMFFFIDKVYRSNKQHTIKSKMQFSKLFKKYFSDIVFEYENSFCQKKYSRKIVYSEDNVIPNNIICFLEDITPMIEIVKGKFDVRMLKKIIENLYQDEIKKLIKSNKADVISQNSFNSLESARTQQM
jgi:hypothetical protein